MLHLNVSSENTNYILTSSNSSEHPKDIASDWIVACGLPSGRTQVYYSQQIAFRKYIEHIDN
jgi:hypothetical protein